MTMPRSYTETCTAMSKASLGRTSLCPLSSESQPSFPCPETWPTVPTETTTPVSALSPSLSHPNSFGAADPVSAQSFAMSLPMLSNSILGKMMYGAWLDGMAKSYHRAQKDAPTGSQKSFGENPSTMTISSSKPSIEGPDHDPDTWGSKDTP